MDLRNAVQYFGMDSTRIECPFARLLLDHLGDVPTDEPIIVDSRLSMLMPGWYPCIPGWHYDEITRKADGSLDWDRNRHDKMHYIMVIDEGTGSFTEIARLRPMAQRSICFPLVDNYTALNEWMEDNDDGCYWIEKIRNQQICVLTNTTPHRGTPAIGKGWRYFVRATINTQRSFVNEIRTQTQVYIPAIDIGW